MVGYWLGYSTSIHSCATICGNCLVNRDRATGMPICETVAAGLLGVAGPIVGCLCYSASRKPCIHHSNRKRILRVIR